MNDIGTKIIDEIIKQQMFRVERVADSHIFIWNANAAEQLEALVNEHSGMNITEKQIAAGLRPARYFDLSSTEWKPCANPARVKYVNALRLVVSRRMPKNKCGVAIVSDVDLLLAEEWEVEEAISKV